MTDIMQSGYSRVFLIKNRAAPNHSPMYQGLWKAGALSWAQGDVTNIYVPDPDNYNAFKVAGDIAGDIGRPEMTIMGRYSLDVSELLRLAPKGCKHDFQIHMGKCENPQDFNHGWSKILVLEGGKITNYSTEDLGALEPSQRAVVNEEVPISADDAYEVKALGFASKARTEVTEEVVDTIFCRGDICAECDADCSTILALMSPASYAKARYVFSTDGGLTWTDGIVSSSTANDVLDAFSCVGDYLVVLNRTAARIEYARLSDVTSGSPTWTSVSTGFVAAGAPLAIWSASPSFTWIVGLGGYIYLMEDPSNGVSVQDAGVATPRDLHDIHGVDSLNVVAVGNDNSVVYTNNGGLTWTSVTGPNPSDNLNCVWMASESVWWVGDEVGNLWYTLDKGSTWTAKVFPGSGSGSVEELVFVKPSVGYMIHNVGGAGKLLRTIDGGYSWYVLPEGSGVIPTNTRLNSLAVCSNPNICLLYTSPSPRD